MADGRAFGDNEADTAFGAAAIIGGDILAGTPPGDFSRVIGAMTMRFGSVRLPIAMGVNSGERSIPS